MPCSARHPARTSILSSSCRSTRCAANGRFGLVPAADISSTITLIQSNAPLTTLTTIHSKDRSRAFIGDKSRDLALHDLTFTFTYLEYNAISHVPASVVTASFFASPTPGHSIGNSTSPSLSATPLTAADPSHSVLL